jgi:hypothetical protein
LWRQKDDLPLFMRNIGVDTLNRTKYRFRFENHALTSAKRPIVNRFVPIRSEIPQIVNLETDPVLLLRLIYDSVRERADKKTGEYGENVKHQMGHFSVRVEAGEELLKNQR